MNYLVMDRASEAAANDLAEVRKLIEGMNALVYSQIQQQQARQLQQFEATPTEQTKQSANLLTTHKTDNEQSSIIEKTDNQETNTTTSSSPPSLAPQQTLQQEHDPNNTQYSAPIPQAGVIVEATHLTFNRVIYFQLAPEATIEPVIAWLRLSYQDAAVSGMVLQYKGIDGLWKCLLNRDDALRRILNQCVKKNTMLQIRVPRKEDLVTSGYTDQRLLALTKTESMQQQQ